MDEMMDQVETTDDVIETEPEIIEDTDEDSFAPILVVGGIVTAAAVAIVTQRKRISNYIDKKCEERLQKRAEKTGRQYAVIESNDVSESEDKEN